MGADQRTLRENSMSVDEAIETAVEDAIGNAEPQIVEEIAEEKSPEPPSQQVVVVTGSESSGLTREELEAALTIRDEQLKQAMGEMLATALIVATPPPVEEPPDPMLIPLEDKDEEPPADEPPAREHPWFRRRGNRPE